MPDDLDGRLAGLRDELRGTVAVPDIATVADRHRQRRFRRRTQIGAVVAVLVVSAVVPILRGQQQPDPAPPATPPPSSPAPTGSANDPFVYAVQFADADHGFALRAQCDGAGPRDCSEVLFGTRDGESWSGLGPLPEPASLTGGGLGQLRVLGQDEVAVDWFTEYSTARTARMYSDDGGLTWREVPVPNVVTETVQAIPAGAQLAPTCLGNSGSVEACTDPSFVVVLPGSGRSARLATVPDLTEPWFSTVPTADGHWWVAGRRPNSSTWAIAVSANDGRSWTTTDLDWQGTPNMWSVVSRGGTLYASAVRVSGSENDGLQGIFRSDDDGRTWTLTWQPTDEQRLRWFSGSLVAADDGTVTAYEFNRDNDENTLDNNAYLSTDGGHTLVRSDSDRIGDVGWVRGGYLALSMSVEDQGFEFSTDGVDWRRYKLPPEE